MRGIVDKVDTAFADPTGPTGCNISFSLRIRNVYRALIPQTPKVARFFEIAI